jgi:nonsense-mediated mRNA decay protein 3
MEVEMSETSFRSNPAYYHRRGFRKFLKMDVELSRSDEVGISSSHIYSHLGHVLKPGDTVLAYDLRSVNSCGDLELPANAPDFLIVKKVFPQRKANRKRIWKLRRM